MILIIQAQCASLLIFSGAVASSPLTSVTVPEAGAYRSETALTDSTEPKVFAGGDLGADLGQIDENDVAQRFLGVVRDADGRTLAVGFDPLVFFGVLEVGRIGHVSF